MKDPGAFTGSRRYRVAAPRGVNVAVWRPGKGGQGGACVRGLRGMVTSLSSSRGHRGRADVTEVVGAARGLRRHMSDINHTHCRRASTDRYAARKRAYWDGLAPARGRVWPGSRRKARSVVLELFFFCGSARRIFFFFGSEVSATVGNRFGLHSQSQIREWTRPRDRARRVEHFRALIRAPSTSRS